tara:strand:+ start:49 stop:300 length:252 start_codon:yes stop_codon:yes gene_type:complete
MTKFLGTSSNTLSYIHWINQGGTVYGIINASHILDNVGAIYDASVNELLDCDQDYQRESNLIVLDNGQTMIIHKDQVSFEKTL